VGKNVSLFVRPCPEGGAVYLLASAASIEQQSAVRTAESATADTVLKLHLSEKDRYNRTGAMRKLSITNYRFQLLEGSVGDCPFGCATR